jgi:hypothetical protein
MILQHGKTMGGVDLLSRSTGTKKYAISIQLQKWYWAVWTWYLNLQMVQAWRLYRQTWAARHAAIRGGDEKQEDSVLEPSLQNASTYRQCSGSALDLHPMVAWIKILNMYKDLQLGVYIFVRKQYLFPPPFRTLYFFPTCNIA